jgi:hypothetical protein
VAVLGGEFAAEAIEREPYVDAGAQTGFVQGE